MKEIPREAMVITQKLLDISRSNTRALISELLLTTFRNLRSVII